MSKKIKKKSSSNTKDSTSSILNPSTTLSSLIDIPRQLDSEKILQLSKRNTELTQSNGILRSSLFKNEAETNDITIYFTREMEMKDEIIAKLNSELMKKEQQLTREMDSLKQKYDQKLIEYKQQQHLQFDELQLKFDNARAELQSIELFRNEKDEYYKKLQLLESKFNQNEVRYKKIIDDMEKKFFEEKMNMIQTHEDLQKNYHNQMIDEVKSQLSNETKQLFIDYHQLQEDIKTKNNTIFNLQIEKRECEDKVRLLMRDINLMHESQLEQSKIAVAKTQEIKSLKESLSRLELRAKNDLESLKLHKKSKFDDMHKELESTTVDAVSLRKLLEIKNKELRKMKTLANTILSHRSDVEQFFLEALEEVRQVLAQEKLRELQQQQEQLNYLNGENVEREDNQQLKNNSLQRRFPHLKNSKNPYLASMAPSNLGNSILSQVNSNKIHVNISDMTWKDRELVLQILFAKINGIEDEKKRVKSTSRASSYQSTRNIDDTFPPLYITQPTEDPSNDIISHPSPFSMI